MSSFVISDVRVFDGEFVTHERGYVVIEGTEIKAVSSVEPVDLAAGCIKIDGTGCTVLPGLIDAHVHPYHDVDFLEKSIQFGVTTVIDMHNEPHWFKDLKDIANKRNDVSDVRSVCYAATVKGGWPSAIVKLISQEPGIDDRLSKWPNITNVASAEEYVAKNVAAGASYIKLMGETGSTFDLPFPKLPIPTPTLDIQKAIVKAAHKHKRLAVAHALSLEDTLRMLDAGVDGLAHACNEASSNELIQAYKKANAFVIPTLAVQASASGEEQESRERFANSLTSGEKDHMCTCLKISRQGFSMRNASDNVRALKAAGIDIICGTDSSNHLKG